MPSRLYQAGDIVFVRAVVLDPCSDVFQVRIEDYPKIAITTWVPASEIAKAEDIDRLRPLRFPGAPLLAR